MKNVLFWWAFDPPHQGHAAIAKGVLEKTGAERIVIVPSWPRRDKAYKAAEVHRRRILELFVESFEDPRFVLDTDFLDGFETLGPTTTVAMDAHYFQKFDERPYQVYGADTVDDMGRWVQGEKVRLEVPKILVHRDGKIPDISRIANFLIVEFDLPKDLQPLSSTEIRRRIREEASYEGLSPKVAEYVRQVGAYR